MIRVDIPGQATLAIKHLVLDFNGTLAEDGLLVDDVRQRLQELAELVEIHVITADTFGSARSQLADLPCHIEVLSNARQDLAKAEVVERCGANVTTAIGNGLNDRLMLAQSRLGICVILAEGAASETLVSADVVCTKIADALDLLLNTTRLIATLRR